MKVNRFITSLTEIEERRRIIYEGDVWMVSG